MFSVKGTFDGRVFNYDFIRLVSVTNRIEYFSFGDESQTIFLISFIGVSASTAMDQWVYWKNMRQTDTYELLLLLLFK